jgi:fibronectin type 3 domain-containing protein
MLFLPTRFFKRLLIAFLVPLLVACGSSSSGGGDNPAPPPQISFSLKANSTTVITIIAKNFDSTNNYYVIYRGTKSDASDRRKISSSTSTSYVDRELSADTLYYYWMQVCVSGEASCSTSLSSAISARTRLHTPKNISLNVNSTSQITVSWDNVIGTNYYEIYRGTNSNASDRNKISSRASNSYADTGLESNTLYYYWVKACNAGGTCSDFSQASLATTLLNAPKNISSDVNSTSQITVSWDNVTGTNHYEIHRGTKKDASDRSEISSPTSTSYADTGLESNTLYYYWVKACNAQDICSEFSSVKSDKTQRELDSPENINLNINSSSQIRVSWSEITQADLYEIYRGTRSDASDRRKISSSTSNTPYLDIGLTPNTTYYYWIRACNTKDNSCSAFSSATSATTELVTGVPQNLNLRVNSASEITVLWDSVAETNHYQIYRGTNSDASDRSEISSPTSNSYADTGLDSNTIYYYWIKACNAGGTCSDFSQADSATTLLNAPKNIRLSVNSTSQITVLWDNITGTNHYEIHRGTNSDASDRNKISSLTVTSYADTGLGSNTTYYYWIKACNAGGTCSDFSQASSATTPLNAPKNIHFNVNSASEITVLWDSVAETNHYQIYRGTNSDASDRSEISSPTSTSYADTGLGSNTTYYYWIKACNAQGTCSNFSQASSATTSLNAPKNIHLNVNSTSQITVSWDSVADANYYEIYRATISNTSNSTKIAEPSDSEGNSYIDNSLTPNTVYYYWMKACQTGGTCSDFSLPVTTRTFTSASHDTATYTWTEVTSSTAFSDRYDHSSVVFDKKMWLIGGSESYNSNVKNDVWSSTNGVTWTQVKANNSEGFSKRYDYISVVFDDKMWVMGGLEDGSNVKNDVWSSTNGVTWTEVKANNSEGFSKRYSHTSVVFNDGNGEKMWVIGGFDISITNDVWSSTNGATWTEVKANNSEGFSKRYNHTSVVFNDGNGEKMWVIGGHGKFGNFLNDVWSSTNGKTWTKVKANNSAGFSKREEHTSVVFDSKIWVIGGNDGGRDSGDNPLNTNDVWSSTNGETWTEVKANNSEGFSKRKGHTSVVFDSRVWVIGGAAENDVWFMAK